MDAPYYNGSDDRESIHNRPSRVSPRILFKYACDGLLSAVMRASIPADRLSDDMWHEAEAVWFAKHVASEARRLKLVPEHPVDVRVLVDLDVLAGEKP